jgi:hypothetical protein
MIIHTDGNYMQKYKPLAEESPKGRVIWEWGINEPGLVYLWHYDLFQETHAKILIPGTVPVELEFEVIPGSIRPPKGAPFNPLAKKRIRHLKEGRT